MKLICAGFPKTGSKSCSTALRTLGYTVADIIETLEFLTGAWLNFGTGKGSIEDVVAEYDKLGFDTNQDAPGNLHWEALYDASPPGTKVWLLRIHTINLFETFDELIKSYSDGSRQRRRVV